jgi:hypothetical protein
VLLVAILHFIADAEDPRGIIDTLMAAVPSGSYLVVSRFTADSYAKADEAGRVYEEETCTAGRGSGSRRCSAAATWSSRASSGRRSGGRTARRATLGPGQVPVLVRRRRKR